MYNLRSAILICDKDICKALYVDPLKKVRKDWPIVEIPDAGHFDSIFKPQFQEEVAAWVRKNSK